MLMYQSIIEQFRKFVNIDENEIKSIIKNIKPIKLKNKEILLKEGQICKSNYFVDKGCLRIYFINDKGSEQITQFALENWWLADYYSFIEQKPSAYYIQAIEKTDVLALDFNMQDELFSLVPQLERYFRIIAQKAIAASQIRSKLLYELSKEDFYLHFSSSFPKFVQRVPQYMIASYLGLSPEYLSEIKAKNK